ncbi:uncharacterized protein SCODWIG_02067 [Saccharomycodes ludwigii]|uniref:Uncharacterized protein n=1 Tax=Saccharomycodes ludwigii TaxID=36035 RepID=A0A376B6I7_9ASCO|nr:hypothetical protein SCDLUD_003420 [Saccharomycodes ludwigii]KAH3900438.1 hypothetical protein SCDLUD_003420 [Saccharomycodes ludwigii]SSD60306.1 uncharacterized protein SCODWIG_02067 [Saccharomycodes ludwigii]
MWPNSDTWNYVHDKINTGSQLIVDTSIRTSEKLQDIGYKTTEKLQDISCKTGDKLKNVYHDKLVPSLSVVKDSISPNTLQHNNNGSNMCDVSISGVIPNSNFISRNVYRLAMILDDTPGDFSIKLFKIACILGTSSLLLHTINKQVFKKKVYYLDYKDSNKVILVLGSMIDPITRNQVYDLYKRGFIIYVCSTTTATATEDESENSSTSIKDERLKYITSSPENLALFVRTLGKENLCLVSIIFSPSVFYYPSDIDGSKLFQSEINENLMELAKVLWKITPYFHKLKIFFITPSLSNNLRLNDIDSNTNLEILTSNIIKGLYKSLLIGNTNKHKVYLINLGLLSFSRGSNLANYKYLNVPHDNAADSFWFDEYFNISGSNIQENLLNPIANLIMCRSYYYIFRNGVNSVWYCGKGAYISKIFGCKFILQVYNLFDNIGNKIRRTSRKFLSTYFL